MLKFIVILFTFSSLFGQDVVKKLQNKFNNIHTLQAKFIQATAGTSLSGKFSFRKENNYRIEFLNNIIISDGKNIYNIDKKRKRVVISNLEDDPLSFSLYDYIFNYPSICEVTEEKLDNGYLLSFDASKRNFNFKLAQLWVSTSYLITKIKVIDFTGNEFVFNFSEMKVDQIFPSDYFKFENKMNYKIIDLR